VTVPLLATTGWPASSESFCDRWQTGVEYLTEDGQQLARNLIDSAGTYLEVEQQAAHAFG